MKPHRIQVRFADIDAMGHVNNAVFLHYFEQGRIQFFKEVIDSEWDWNKYGLIVARNEIDYLKPVLLEDEIYITGKLGAFGNKSFQMHMHLFKQTTKGEESCVKGLVTLVCFDYELKQTIPIPEAWKKAAGKASL